MRKPIFAGLTALGLALGVAGCVAPIQATRTFNDPTQGHADVVLLTSGSNSAADAVSEAFARSLGKSVTQFTLAEGAPPRRLAQTIRRLTPGLVVALGGRAAFWAHGALADLPLLYSLVVQGQSGVLKGDRIGGISLELSAATEFSLYKMVLPSLTRVIAFYTPEHSSERVKRAQRELKDLEVELLAVPVEDAQGLDAAFARHAAEGEAVWLLEDPMLMSREAFTVLQRRTVEAHKPLLCSTFREFAKAGAMMAVSVDFDNVGAQLAAQAGAVLNPEAGGTAFEVRSPIGGHLVVNLQTASLIGVEVPARIHPFISEMISKQDDAPPN